MSEAAGFDPSLQPQLSPAQEAGENLRSYVRWGVKELVVVAMVTLMLIFVISLAIVGPVASHYGEEAPETYGASSLATIFWDFCYVMTALLVVRSAGGGFANLGVRRAIYIPRDVYDTLRRRLHSSTYVWLPRIPLAIVAGYLVAYLCVLIYNLLVSLAGLDFLQPSEQLPEGLFDSSIVVAISGIAIVFVTPITEELLFRGFLFGGIRRYLPFWQAALISGFIFSVAHGNVGLIVPFTLIGIVLAFTYERTGTIFASMGVHFIFNAVSFSLLLLFPDLR